MSTIEVDWPTAPLSEVQNRRRLQELSERAEAMVGRQPGLQDQARLALEWVALCWSGISPETVAASARATLILGHCVVMATDPASQLLEVADRLNAIWAAAQTDPAAAVVEVHLPLLEMPPRGEDRPRKGRRPKAKVELEPADLPDPPEALEPVAEEPADLGAEEEEPAPLEPDDLGIDAQLGPAVEALEPAPPAPAPPEPAPPAPAAPTADTSGFFTVAEATEILQISTVTLWRWRIDGRLGLEGAGWVACGKTFLFNPGPIESLIDGMAAQREARSNRAPRRRPCAADHKPDGWMVPDELAAILGCSGSKVRRQIREGIIPAEMLHRVGRRSQWLDPAVVELLAKKTPR